MSSNPFFRDLAVKYFQVSRRNSREEFVHLPVAQRLNTRRFQRVIESPDIVKLGVNIKGESVT